MELGGTLYMPAPHMELWSGGLIVFPSLLKGDMSPSPWLVMPEWSKESADFFFLAAGLRGTFGRVSASCFASGIRGVRFFGFGCSGGG